MSTEAIPDIPTAEFNSPKQWAEIKTQMEEHQGEFVLVIERRWDRHIAGGPDEHLRLGIVAEPCISQREGDVDLEVITPLQSTVLPFGQVKVDEGPIRGILGTLLNCPLEKREGDFFSLGDPGVRLEVVVGDEAVMSRIKREERAVANFAKMTRGIGRPLEDMEDFSQEMVELLEGSKRNLVENILGLVSTEREISNELRKIQGGKDVHLGNGLDFVGLDQQAEADFEDGKKIRSIKPTEDLTVIRRRIRGKLVEAFDLGLHLTDLKLEKEERPGLKTEVDVRVLISNLCQSHGVPIPQD